MSVAEDHPRCFLRCLRMVDEAERAGGRDRQTILEAAAVMLRLYCDNRRRETKALHARIKAAMVKH